MDLDAVSPAPRIEALREERVRQHVLLALDGFELGPVERDAAGAPLAPLVISVSRSQHLPDLGRHFGPILWVLVIAAREDPLRDLDALLIEQDL
eukprot:226346-Prymnesium_polylepis.1